ncbi:MAG: hypothetical protein KDA79_08990 [Planctomycetaceae bacterium]|nr:hypothetical protein [Planctomycetaceae bacterium]
MSQPQRTKTGAPRQTARSGCPLAGPAMFVGLMLVLCTMPGCEKIPTFGELIGQDQAEESVEGLQTKHEPGPSVPLTTREEPASTGPDPAITSFRGTAPNMRTDSQLVALGSLDSGLERMEDIDLSSSTVTAVGLAELKKFPAVRKLTLSMMMQMTPEMIEEIGEIKTLEVLELTGSPLSGISLEPLSSLPALVEINLSNTGITDEVLEHFKPIETLEVLRLDGNPINGAGFRYFERRGFPNRIRVVDVSNTSFSQQGFPFLRGWRTLEEFHAGQSGVFDLCLASLGTCKELKVLTLGYNPQITDEGVKRLASLRKLERLDLHNCSSVSDQGMYFIRNNKGLQAVDAEGTSVSRNGALGLKKFAPEARIAFRGGVVQ